MLLGVGLALLLLIAHPVRANDEEPEEEEAPVDETHVKILTSANWAETVTPAKYALVS